ncbi:7 transmembrane sweet-taste receptor of 3 GCPR-domain-containing protein [Obelidium mucronatum]|nr:7 transmembrane sweet-taste receptor of 3 GCPR-domain-containing protein [Obelidium mucronatum]
MLIFFLFQAIAVPASNKPAEIVVGIIGPYGLLNGLSYNGSQVTGGLETLNTTDFADLSMLNPSSWWWWNQLGAQLAIQEINERKIFSNLSASVKIFNDFDYDSVVGYAGQAIQDITDNHPEISALQGGFYTAPSLVTASIASVSQIPFCGAVQYSPKFSNKFNYPFFFNLYPYSGVNNALIVLLKYWNVRRLAYISADGIENDVLAIADLRSAGIEIVSHIVLQEDLVLDSDLIRFVANELTVSDARYIYLADAGSRPTQMYYTLAQMNVSVGPDYVWLMNTNLMFLTNGIELYGNDYFLWARGVIQISGEAYLDYHKMNNIVSQIRKTYGLAVELSDLYLLTNLFASYDCVLLLAQGIYNVLEKTGFKYSVAELKSQLNYTAFMDTGYEGTTSSPMKLTRFGDAAVYLNGDFLNSNLTKNNSRPYGYYYQTGFNEYRWFGSSDTNQTFITAEGYEAIFFNGSSIPPFDGFTEMGRESVIGLQSGYAAIILSLEAIGLLTCLLVFHMLYKFQQFDTIRQSSVVFSRLLNGGIGLVFLSMNAFLGRQTVALCHIQTWAQLIPFSLTIACILAKNCRVYLIFSSRTIIHKRWLRDRVWLGMAAGLVLIQSALLAAWSYFNEPRIIRKSINSQSYVYQCTQSKRSVFVNVTLALWCFNITLIIASFAMSYMIRSVTATHNESVLVLLFSIGIIIGGSLVLLVAYENPQSMESFFIHAVILWAMAMFLQVSMFGAKAVALYFEVTKYNALTSSLFKGITLAPRLTAISKQSVVETEKAKNKGSSKPKTAKKVPALGLGTVVGAPADIYPTWGIGPLFVYRLPSRAIIVHQLKQEIHSFVIPSNSKVNMLFSKDINRITTYLNAKSIRFFEFESEEAAMQFKHSFEQIFAEH